MKKIGFFFDCSKLGHFTFDMFLSGDIGLGGTDSQLLLLMNELTAFYEVYVFTNADFGRSNNFRVFIVTGVNDAAQKANSCGIDLFILTGKEDEPTRLAIIRLNQLKQPFIIWETIGPGKGFERLLSESAYLKRIVCVSRTHANSHRHRAYFPKITFIYNGKDYKEPSRSRGDGATDDFNIGYLGAVSPGKGFHWVARAWPAIRREFPGSNLYVIGSIRTHNRQAVTGDLGIAVPDFEEEFVKPFLGKDLQEISSNGVHFTGNLSPNEMDRYLKMLDLGIVNPNHNNFCETFCVAALDFQGYNIPVIGANKGGLRESINRGKTGILINNSNRLAETVIALLKDRKRRSYLSGNGYAWVKNYFSRQQVAAQWVRLIDDVLSDRKNELVRFSVADINLRLLAMEVVRITGISRRHSVVSG